LKNKVLIIILISVVVGLVTGIFFLIDNQEKKPDYLISVTNSNLVNSSTFEFDITVQAIDEPFELSAYQCALIVWERLKETDTLYFSFIEGTSELSIIPQTSIIVDRSSELPKIAFASLPGNEIITSSPKRIGRFRIKNTKGFFSEPMLEWNFSGQYTTIIAGKYFKDITVNSQLIVTGD
jgi:hypothetical protein